MHQRVNGHSIAIATGGKAFDVSKPVVVFLHGAGMEGTVWQLPARWFAHHGWSVLVPDLPGHGRSGGAPLATIDAMAAFMLELLQALHVKRAVLIGHSMGGAIALEAARRLGTDALGLGLIGSAAKIPVGAGLLTAARDAPETAFRMMVQGAYSRRAKMGGSPMPGTWMTGIGLALFRRGQPGALAVDLMACNAWETGQIAAQGITCPTIVISAAEDAMTPPHRSVELARLLPNAAHVVVPRVGHMVMAEAPEATLNALIAQFGHGDSVAG